METDLTEGRYVDETVFESPVYNIREGKILVFIYSQPRPHGIADVIKTYTDNRNRTEDVDYYHLRSFFRDTLNVKDNCIMLKINSTPKEVLDDLDFTNSTNRAKFKECDCFFIVFLTYSSPSQVKKSKYQDDRIQLYENEAFSLEEVYKKVGNIPELAMKPKVFLIQADDIHYLKPEVFIKGGVAFEKRKIPQDSDRLIIRSTIPQQLGFDAHLMPDYISVSVKSPKKYIASFLIKAFVDVLQSEIERNRGEQNDLLTLTTLMNGKVCELIKGNIANLKKKYSTAVLGNEKCELPCPTVMSTLSKLLYFKAHQL